MVRLYVTFLSIFCLICSGTAFADRGNVVPGDYDADGRTDIVITRAVNNTWQWYFRLATGVEIGPVPFGLAPEGNADMLLSGDFDGDKDFDLNVIRVISGFLNWFSLRNDGAADQVVWGLEGDTPVTGFFGGSGENDRVAVRDTGAALVWYIENIAPAGISWGLPGDTPFAADLTGDGVDELIVARSDANGITWFGRNLSGSFTSQFSFGLGEDTLLPPSDFNGDGKADVVVTRDFGDFKVFFIRYTDLDLAISLAFGLKDDKPYIGNFTQGSLAELALFRVSDTFGSHFVRFAGDGQVVNVPFGLRGDRLSRPEALTDANTEEDAASTPGCVATPGTATDFSDGARRGALWKPVSEGVSNEAPVALLPISYCGATLTVLGSDGAVVSGIQRVKCGGNGNRAHFWITQTANTLTAFQPLTVQIQRRGVTECRSVPVARQRYD